jgi:hypothetical protein
MPIRQPMASAAGELQATLSAAVAKRMPEPASAVPANTAELAFRKPRRLMLDAMGFFLFFTWLPGK